MKKKQVIAYSWEESDRTHDGSRLHPLKNYEDFDTDRGGWASQKLMGTVMGMPNVCSVFKVKLEVFKGKC